MCHVTGDEKMAENLNTPIILHGLFNITFPIIGYLILHVTGYINYDIVTFFYSGHILFGMISGLISCPVADGL